LPDATRLNWRSKPPGNHHVVNKVTALLILLIGLLQYKLWFGDGNVLEFQRLNDRIAELRQEGAKRRERNAALEAEVMDLKQGLDAVEERARHELGMVMEGEEFVQVIEPQSEPASSPVPEMPAAKDELPEAAKASKNKKEKSHTKKKSQKADTAKPTESPPTSAKKPAVAKNKISPNPQTAPNNALPRPKPVRTQQPTAEPEPTKPSEEGKQ
jgi:cell division protein FtsB